jgi:spore coat protein U-like protein
MSNRTIVSKYLGRITLASALGAGALFAQPESAKAGTNTADLDVSATVAANCSIATVPLAFGSYDPITANAVSSLDGTGTVTVTCTNGSVATVTLGQGVSPDAESSDAAPARRMTDGANYLAYTLYSDPSRTVVWGNTSGTGASHEGSGIATNLTVYGSVAGGQNVPAGEYADTVVATVTF